MRNIKYVLIYTVIAILFLAAPLSGQEKNDKVIRACFLSSGLRDVNVNDAKLAMKILTRKVAERTKKYRNHKIEVLIARSLPEMIKLLKDNKIHLVSLAPAEFYHVTKRIKLTPIMMSSKHDKPQVRFLLLVRKDRGVKRIEDLRGKKVYIQNTDQEKLMKIWMDVQLKEQGLQRTEKFFDLRSVKTSKAVLQVYFKVIDACIVEEACFQTLVELNPDLGRKLTPIYRSDKFPDGILALPADHDDEFKKTIVKIASNLHMDPEGRQILTIFRKKRSAPFDDRYMKNLEKLMKRHKELVKQN